MVTTNRPQYQRLGDRVIAKGLAPVPTPSSPSCGTPSGRYAEDGDFYLGFPFECLGGDDLLKAFQVVIARNLPVSMLDYDDDFSPGTMWTHWSVGPRTEAIARLFWPGLTVAAKGNTCYQQGGEVAAQLKTIRQALVAAEAAVRCGTAFGAAR
jgi:hypothetical protein